MPDSGSFLDPKGQSLPTAVFAAVLCCQGCIFEGLTWHVWQEGWPVDEGLLCSPAQNLTLAIKPLPAFLGILVPLGIGDALQEFIQIKVALNPPWRQAGLPHS